MKILRQELYEIEGNLKKIINLSDLQIDNLNLLKDEIEINLNFSRTHNSVDINGELNSDFFETCDKCIDTFNKNKKLSFRVIVSENDANMKNLNSEFIYFDINKNEIDLSSVIRDTLLLEKPMKSICKENCKGLCSNCGINLNKNACICNQN